MRTTLTGLVSPTKTLNRDVAPIGDDIEPSGDSNVEMGNEEDEEPMEAEIPSVRVNPKNPTSREKQEHEDSGHAVYRSWCAACVEGRGVGGRHRIELLEEEERERTTPIVAFDYGFLTQENADTLPILICRDSKHGATGATCCERQRFQSMLHFISRRFHQRSWFLEKNFEIRQWTEYGSTSRCSDSSMCGSGSDSTRTTRVITWPMVVLKWL